MAKTAQQILDIVSDQVLNDTANTRWPQAELLEWLHEGQRVIVSLVSDAKIARGLVTLQAGSRQDLETLVTSAPLSGDSAFRLIDIVRAYDSNATTSGTIRRCQKAYVNVVQRKFYTETSTTLVRDWFYDDSNPLEFEVYPPADGTDAQVEVVYNPVPTDVLIGANVDIAEHYYNALIDYIAYRAFSKDTEDVSPDLGRAQAYYTNFSVAMGLKDIGDVDHEPRKIEVT